VDTIEQARDRVKGGAKRDTGRHAVEAVLAALAIKDQLAARRGPTGFAAV
jgi:6,7-dimethyl-8-ribityllumazine synthase